ncbi:FCD domain-containing protein [Pararhodobacter oceanensis]|uniref:Pyruvate dehydrogenase complex repressor n=1 Tax=Pararhodobacter oceanensis TaxID=2172121 RepID=A0A2T8HS77_9RHOB|nr:FCD domain-containing protein [Pararhodobacter oceanensis]PVH28291.1 GntR family transcriptional regulator [Pararhodobacter oceanensis]
MPFQPVHQEKLAKGVVRQIELLILRGLLRPGERLPSERDLAERMGVSRPSLREAIADLEARELLVSRAGSGVYVADMLQSTFPKALIELFATHDEAVFDYVSFRRDLEGMAAERAARFGSETDLKVIEAVFSKMEEAHFRQHAADEAALDAEFHLAIIEASHNIVMLHTMRVMFDLLKAGVFYNRQQLFRQCTTRDTLLEQHRAIHLAIQARDPKAAREAAEAHMTYVETVLDDLRKADKHEGIAQLRYKYAVERG